MLSIAQRSRNHVPQCNAVSVSSTHMRVPFLEKCGLKSSLSLPARVFSRGDAWTSEQNSQLAVGCASGFICTYLRWADDCEPKPSTHSCPDAAEKVHPRLKCGKYGVGWGVMRTLSQRLCASQTLTANCFILHQSGPVWRIQAHSSPLPLPP